MSFTGIKSLERLSVGKKLGLLGEAFFNTIVVNSLQFLSSIFLVLLVCRSPQPIRTPMNACAIYLPIALPPLRLTELSIENQKKKPVEISQNILQNDVNFSSAYWLINIDHQ